jgi:hypothetical protein
MFLTRAIRPSPAKFAALAALLIVFAALPAGAQAAPTASFNPAGASFADTLIGQSTPSQPLVLTNDGPDPIDISGVSLAGLDQSDFTIADGCTGRSLSSGDNCTVDVAFAPTARGPRSAELDVSHTGNDSPSVASLSGNGLLKELTISPPLLSFPATTVGNPGGQLQVTVKNNSDVTVSVYNVFIDGIDPSDFNHNSTCGGGLLPGQGCDVNVSFNPGSAGNKDATLHIQSDDAQGDHQVDLQGIAASPQLAFEPASFDFGLQQVNNGGAQTNLQLRNTGAAAVQVNSVDVIGPGSNVFFTGFTNCFSQTLQPNDTCSVQVNFNPNNTIPYAAQLRVGTNGVSFTADLSGAGGSAIVTTSPNPADFGSAAVGGDEITRTITVSNTGNLPTGFIVAVVSGGDVASFRLLDESCTAGQLAPSASCTAHVGFRPISAGPKTAQLSFIGDQGGGAPVILTGVGVTPHASLSPTSYNFGLQAANTTGSSQTFALTNSGGAPLRLNGASVVGADADQFRLSGDDCTDVTLAIGADCEVRVRFAPNFGGVKSARLRITGDGAPVTASLAGTGSGAAETPRVTFHRSGHGPLHRSGAALVAGSATCDGASGCRLRAHARVLAKVRGAFTARKVGVDLPSIRRTIAAGETRTVRLPLNGSARRLLKSNGGRLLLTLSWTADGYPGRSSSSFPVG